MPLIQGSIGPVPGSAIEPSPGLVLGTKKCLVGLSQARLRERQSLVFRSMLEGGHQGERWSEAGGDLFMIIFVKMSYVCIN